MNRSKSMALRLPRRQELFAACMSLLVFFGCAISLVAQDRGNTSFQEYGDAVYRQLDPSASFGYDYNHTAIFCGP